MLWPKRVLLRFKTSQQVFERLITATDQVQLLRHELCLRNLDFTSNGSVQATHKKVTLDYVAVKKRYASSIRNCTVVRASVLQHAPMDAPDFAVLRDPVVAKSFSESLCQAQSYDELLEAAEKSIAKLPSRGKDPSIRRSWNSDQLTRCSRKASGRRVHAT